MDKQTVFKNLSALPIMLDAWIGDDPFLNSLRIEPHETRTIYSRHGEWHLHTMFDRTDKQKWFDVGITQNVMGKFRCFPCCQGEYSWMDHPNVTCTFIGDSFEFRVRGVKEN